MRLLLIVAAVAIAGCGGSPSAPEDVKSLIVVGTPPSIGTSTQFTALARHNDGSTAPLTSRVTWISSNPLVATVKDDGTVTGVSLGSVEISATADGVRGALAFNVTSGPAFHLTGTVFAGRPIAGATVVARDASGATISVVTDSFGTFSIGGIAAGPADVTARAEGQIAQTRSTQIAGDTTLNFFLASLTACPTVGFDDLATQRTRTPFTTFSACGFVVTATTPSWTVATDLGNPPPSIQTLTPISVTATAEIAVSDAAGAKFRFRSVDLYSQQQVVPYTITGIGNGAAQFVLQNSSGSFFSTIRNTDAADVPIDALVIRMSIAGPSFNTTNNVVAIDNIVLAR